MVRRWLYLHEGELQRLLPFFAFYLVLFTAFSLADGLSQALFVKNVGAASLPPTYGAVALANLAVMLLYIRVAETADSVRVFHLFLFANIVVFGGAWWALRQWTDASLWYHLLFACREIAFTVMLMHFGTFLQEFFTRDELGRVLPLVYSGGRVGGICGGALLQHLAEPLGLVNLLALFVGICLASHLLLATIARMPVVSRAEDHLGDAGVAPPRGQAQPDLEQQARASYAGFLRFVWHSPLLFWVTATTSLFILCRWILNFEYSTYFGQHFADDQAMAEFLGQYTQWALAGSTLVQIFAINRIVASIGLRGASLLYAALLLLAMVLCLAEMTFALAVFARLMETELRVGLRNPIMQLITNKFSKTLRVRVRAWSLGLLIPLSTLACSALLLAFRGLHWQAQIPWLGVACGVMYLAASLALARSFRETPGASQAALGQ